MMSDAQHPISSFKCEPSKQYPGLQRYEKQEKRKGERGNFTVYNAVLAALIARASSPRSGLSFPSSKGTDDRCAPPTQKSTVPASPLPAASPSL